jgi:transposase
MNLQNNTTISFKGQHFFLGLDVHKINWKVDIRLNKTSIKRFTMDPSPEQLAKFLKTNYPGGIYHSVYEAGFCGYWIHRCLVDLGIDNIVVNAADIPTSHKEKDRRDDKIDSAKLARELENGSLKAIFIPTPLQQSLRSLARLRYQHRNHITRIKNRIKMFLHLHGLKIPGQFSKSYWSSAFIRWLRSIHFEFAPDHQYLQHYIQQLEYQRTLMKEVLMQMRAWCKQNNTLKCIRSVTGLGVVSSFTIYAELIDMHRFKDLDHLASYVGLVPSKDSTGDWTAVKGLTPRYSRYVRYLLVECAWRAIGSDPALTQAYAKFSSRMPKQKAIIKIAKKLLNRIRYVWLNEKKYVLTIVE